jgi:hypothetical protein
LPDAEQRALASSFFGFKRDPHDLNPQHSISKSQNDTYNEPLSVM